VAAVILALNCGSSSVKWALFDGDRELERATEKPDGAIERVLAKITPTAIGHRVVHGGEQPVRIDDAVLATLEAAVPLAPLHLPPAIAAIRAARRRFPDVPQVACFDTAFHATMPEVARRYALPASFGVRRFGFHGLSYEYICSQLTPAQLRRCVIAHLGSGSSVVAIRDGKSIDTTMGLSPTGGVIMGTRPGDLDPGVLLYLLRDHGIEELTRVLEHESGLRALSETTSDMQELLAKRAHDPRAALAIDAYCASVTKAIGGYIALLGGIDTLVFTGGIGEHANEVRVQIVAGLHVPDLRTIATDEERVVARHTMALALQTNRA
jgi:acetate kinase